MSEYNWQLDFGPCFGNKDDCKQVSVIPESLFNAELLAVFNNPEEVEIVDVTIEKTHEAVPSLNPDKNYYTAEVPWKVYCGQCLTLDIWFHNDATFDAILLGKCVLP